MGVVIPSRDVGRAASAAKPGLGVMPNNVSKWVT